MQITLAINPRSGRGKARANARKLHEMLVKRGHRVDPIEIGSDQQEKLESSIGQSDRVVVIGGDGTVHHLLETLLQSQSPVYHFGTGTANLIRKEFGMSQSPQQAIEHLESEQIVPIAVDVPTCNGVPFLIMVSIGIDASVIHRFEDTRANSGGYRAYVHPIWSEIRSPRIARFRISSPAHERTDHVGMLIIANLRSYGGGFNPCPKADPSDGLLDAALLPCTTSIGTGLKFGLLRLGLTPRSTQRFASSSFQISGLYHDIYVQIDGEKGSRIPGLDDGVLKEHQTLDIEIGKQKLMILSPKALG